MRKGLGFHNRRSPGNYFTPAALFPSGTAGAWYDPSDSTTIFEDTAGTTPSPTPGAGALSVVGKMLDKSGNGNHAISYNTTTARPELSARVNLLTFSEQFDNAAWGNANTTVTANAGVAPDGTTTADLLFPATTGTFRDKTQQVTASSAVYVASCFLKASGFRWAYFRNFGASNFAAHFDLQNGVLGTVQAGFTATIANAGNGWYRCTLTSATPIANPWHVVGMSDADNSSTATASGSNGILAWGADLRPTNIGTSAPAYQRIADQYTYDSSGFPRYLVFNGTASGMYTPANLNLSATDKATVFAGVRKLNQTVNQRIVELSNSTSTNSGSFQMWPGDWLNGTGPNYSFSSRGTTAIAQNQSAESPANYAAPISNVLAASGDIAGDSTILRINGAQVATGTGDQGAGNFGSYPLFVGNRNNSSLWFNGYIYSLIVVGAASTAAQISSTESWINVKEGGVY